MQVSWAVARDPGAARRTANHRREGHLGLDYVTRIDGPVPRWRRQLVHFCPPLACELLHDGTDVPATVHANA